MELKDWQRLHAMNAAWRQWMAEHSGFATPEVIDTLRYMRGELAEAADAEMRQRLSKHPRNNDKAHSIHQELADAAMLALTALPDVQAVPISADWEIRASPEAFYLDELLDYAVVAVENHQGGFWQEFTGELLRGIAEYSGMALEQELRRCWYRLAWKHASAAAAKSYPPEWVTFGVKD